MAKNSTKPHPKVCLLSLHPMVLDAFHRLLSNAGCRVVSRHLESGFPPDLYNLDIPRAAVYVVDTYAGRQATGALLETILDRYDGARLLVVGEKLKETDSFTFLCQGAKGILNYAE